MKTENQKQLPLVTFEQAKRLKKLGFNLECDKLYIGEEPAVRAGGEYFPLERDVDSYANWNDPGYDWNDGVEKEWISAPTVELALKWVRDNYSNEGDVEKGNIIFTIKADFGDDGVFYVPIIHVFEKGKRYDVCSRDFPCESFERAASMLLDELLTILEKDNAR